MYNLFIRLTSENGFMKKLILLFLMLFPLVSFSANKTLVLFDAGSTGTRIYLMNVNTDNAKPEIKTLASAKVSPGIADPSFAANPTLYDTYFNNLLKSVDSNLSAEQKAQTPISLYATAGVRVLPSDTQAAALTEVRKHLMTQAKAYGYAPITTPEQNIRVISGGEEGLFIWIADNYLDKRFDTLKKLSGSNTNGAMELGGASAELSFMSQNVSHLQEHFYFNDTTYKVYSTGYDGFGADATLTKAFQYYQAHGGDFAACFPKNAPYPPANPMLKGDGDFARCQAYLEIVQINPQEVKHCTIHHGANCSGFGRYQPVTPQYQYFLTAGFYYTFKVLGLADQGVTSTHFQQSAREFCGKSWDEIQSQYPNENPQFLVNYCASAAWMNTLFDKWHISSNANLIALEKKDGVSVTWPLGAAYFQVMQ
jgi:hypothetical protein